MPRPEEPLYRKITKSLEDDILSGVVCEGGPVPSVSCYAARFNINPATAAKGVSMLTLEGVLFKRIGIGMFVAPGARERILERRRAMFRARYLEKLLTEARCLGLSKQDLLAMILEEPS